MGQRVPVPISYSSAAGDLVRSDSAQGLRTRARGNTQMKKLTFHVYRAMFALSTIAAFGIVIHGGQRW